MKQSIEIAEKLKKKLSRKYEAEEALYRENQAEKLAAEAREEERRKQIGNTPQNIPLVPSEFPAVNTDRLDFPELNGDANRAEPSAPPAPGDLGPAATYPKDGVCEPSSVGPTPGVPTIPDRSRKPKQFTSSAMGVSYIPQNRYGLRQVVIPHLLVTQFLNLADANTANDVETGGILGGQLAQNKFVVTHLIIPEQSGGPNSFAMEREEMVFEYQDKHDLITLGWIHTHPSQTAFLSSVDLHNHYSYQLMLPEAVAVVCSPKKEQTGVFMLTPDAGMKEIGTCKNPGFHPHTQDPPLFETCPHAVIAEGFTTTVVDLRNS